MTLAVGLLSVVFLLTPYLYSPTERTGDAVGNELVGDGFLLVTRHEVLRDVQEGEASPLAALGTTWWGQVHPETTLYRPVSSLVLATAAALPGRAYDPDAPGRDPIPYHLIVLALNALCALLVLELAWKALGDRRMAFAAGALFATLPVHGEVLFDVAGIAELTSTALALGAWLAWLHAGAKPLAKPAWLGASLGLLFLATLAKENAFALPLVFFAADVGLAARGASLRDGLRGAAAKLPALALCGVVLAASIGLRLAVVGAIFPDFTPQNQLDNPLIGEDPLTRAMNGLRLMGAGLLSMVGVNVLSDGLWRYSADYSFAQVPVLGAFAPANLIGAGAVLGSAVLALVLFKKCRTRAALWLATLAAMLVTANVLFPTGTVYADRLMFLPSVPLVMFLAVFIGRLGRAGVAAALALSIGAGLWTNARAEDWQSQSQLWKHTATRTASGSAKAHFNYGLDCLDGKLPALAASEFERAIEIFPRFADAHAYLGWVNAEQMKTDEAMAAFQRSVELQLEDRGWEYRGEPKVPFNSVPDLLHRLSLFGIGEGKQDVNEGLLAFHDALLAKGYESPTLLFKRAEALIKLERYDEAEDAFQRSLAIKRTVPATLSYGLMLVKLGRVGEARDLYAQITEFRAPGEKAEISLALAGLDLGNDPAGALRLVEDLLLTERRVLSEEQFFRAKVLQAEAKLALHDRDPSGGMARIDEIEDHLKSALSAYQRPSEITYRAYYTLAHLLFRLGKLEEARGVLEQLLAQREMPTQRAMLGRIYEAQGRLEDALDQYARASKALDAGLYAEDVTVDAALVEEVRELHLRTVDALKGEDEARALLASWHDAAPDDRDPYALSIATRWHASAGRIDEAIAAAEGLGASFADRRERADLLVGKLREFDVLARAHEQGVATLQQLEALIELRILFRDSEGAADAARRAIDIAAEATNEEKAELLYWLSVALEQSGKLQEALNQVHKAQSLKDLSDGAAAQLRNRAMGLEAALQGMPSTAHGAPGPELETR